jgi:hypothetical protein
MPQSSLCCGQTSNGHSWWGAAHVVQSGAVAEINRGWIAGMFSADPKLQIWFGAATSFYGQINKFANTSLVKARERVLVIDFFSLIFIVEQPHIITAQTEGRLS